MKECCGEEMRLYGFAKDEETTRLFLKCRICKTEFVEFDPPIKFKAVSE